MKYLIALDAGTTSVRAMLYEIATAKLVHVVQQEVSQAFPRPGWVEQDANEIYYKAAYVLDSCARVAGAEELAGIGIANQRETVVLWNRETGEPIAPAIVWQCRRTAEYCAAFSAEEAERIRFCTGLPMDAYFSASKIVWLLQHVPAARALLEQGKLCAGTIDSYLIFKLTGGKQFVTDCTNASRTMLYDLHKGQWGEELLTRFGIPQEILPKVLPSDARFGEVQLRGRQVPIAGVLGDQQAALFGQACLERGEAKVTYGTGLFLLFHTGEECVRSQSGLVTTVAYALHGKTYYALEGSAFNAGSCVQWLRDELGLLKNSAESEGLAASVPDTGGVYFVPAFTGLGAPYWDPEARGLLTGITRGTTAAHVVRAVLESIAYEARALCDCMAQDSGIALGELRCDGGASANDFLMQFQANILDVPVNRPRIRESTALGAAWMCGIALGLFDEKGLTARRRTERVFIPQEGGEYEKLYRGYCKAVERALYR